MTALIITGVAVVFVFCWAAVCLLKAEEYDEDNDDY